MRRRYDVVFYVPWLGPLLARRAVTPSGGAETQIFLLARALAERGNRVGLIVFDIPDADIPSEFDDVDVIVRSPYRSQTRLIGKLLEAVNIGLSLKRAPSEVVVTRAAGPHVGLVALFARLLGRRFLYSSANVSDFDFEKLSPNRRDRLLFGLGIRLAHQVVVQTNEQVDLCEARFRRRPLLIRSIAEPAPMRQDHGLAFLWIGRMVWYKRPLELITLARNVPEASFWHVGVDVPGAHSGVASEFEEAAVGIPNLALLAPRPRRELMDLVSSAVAIINTADFEGMPNIFLEGWSRGVPALALTHDPDGVIERHGLGRFANGSRARFADDARQLWAGRFNDADLAVRCQRYIADHHGMTVVAAQWEQATGVTSHATRDPTRLMRST